MRTINKQSRKFITVTKSDVQSRTTRITGSGTTPVELEEDYEGTSRQRGKTRVLTSKKLPGTNRMTPPLVTALVENGASVQEALTRIVDSMDEQNEQMSKRMSELEIAVHVERKSLREEINRIKQEVRSGKRLKERTDEYLARNLLRMTREAYEREEQLRSGLEQIQSQQEQTLGTLDTRIDAMLERRPQVIMDRLDSLLKNSSGSGNRATHSRKASRTRRVNFIEQPNKGWTYGSTRGRGNSSSKDIGNNRPKGPTNIRRVSTGGRPRKT